MVKTNGYTSQLTTVSSILEPHYK